MFLAVLTFEWFEDALVFHVFIFIFCLEVRKRYLDESDFRHCYGNFFVSAILKVTFSTIARHIDNSILKNTRELPILQTWINIGANSFIKT